MTYLESVIIIRGQHVSIVVAALITAAISPTWFDCSGPGTRMALLNGLLGPTHIPLPQYVFAFPLLKQAPSVYAVTVWFARLVPGVYCLLTGVRDMRLGSVKMRKHSARSVLHAISGSKSVLSGCSSVNRLRVLRVGVRDILSRWEIPTRGFRTGAISVVRVSACTFVWVPASI